MILRLLTHLLISLTMLCLFHVDLRAQEPGSTKPLDQLVGEDYRYSIDFLFFTRLAEGELRLSVTDEPGVFKAELIGRTLGIASWLAGDRTQTYSSLMQVASDGSLRSIEYTSKIVKRRWGRWQNRGRRHLFDYETSQVVDEKSKEGVVSSKKVAVIPEGQQPVDMLTAFYNLRLGIYGALERGAVLMIPTYAKGGFTEIEVHVLTVEQQQKHKFFPSSGQLLLAKVDPEIFETDSENLYIWLNESGVPERGIVEDLIGLGDVKGYLQEGEL